MWFDAPGRRSACSVSSPTVARVWTTKWWARYSQVCANAAPGAASTNSTASTSRSFPWFQRSWRPSRTHWRWTLRFSPLRTPRYRWTHASESLSPWTPDTQVISQHLSLLEKWLWSILIFIFYSYLSSSSPVYRHHHHHQFAQTYN